ncbi:acid phosphatase 1-like [Rhododendron vialii]|uniref:acid phosphatase 1-like n=1 Tax=Rhododendron vialii TaxID=182163 RepID=UPI00265E442E|nr:acid phosphatase 1-like [Rhododendron vialii]
MATGRYAVALLILTLVSKSISRPIFIQTTPEKLLKSARPDPTSDGSLPRSVTGDDWYCDSWRYSVETNDAGEWSLVPARCEEYVEEYITGGRYRSDSELVAVDASAFAETVNVSGDGMDAWVFDIDETLLSNVPYYAARGFGSEKYNETSWDEWVDLAEAPALPASLKLYKEVQQQGFTIFLLTGRDESQRNITVKNLHYAGYSNWKRLILRQESDLGKLAIVYKSERRKALEDEGYTIHGSSGDQWSDLSGFAIAARSFKLPNPMYYIA